MEEAVVQTRMATQDLHQAQAGLVMGQTVLAQMGLLTPPVTADLAEEEAAACWLEVRADLAEAAAAPKTVVELAALAAVAVALRAALAVREVLSLER